MRRIGTLAAASALFLSLLSAGGVAAGDPVAGCPTGAWWRLILPQHQPQPADHNGDEWLCRLDLPNGNGFTFHDNSVRDD